MLAVGIRSIRRLVQLVTFRNCAKIRPGIYLATLALVMFLRVDPWKMVA